MTKKLLSGLIFLDERAVRRRYTDHHARRTKISRSQRSIQSFVRLPFFLRFQLDD